ncbi:MAG: hypothetical protein M0C28_44690 [Candidatus Moduliflexus flocculans]|nr:hypothetical protein [Candidatus Moduliflexus flocculans]
MNAIIEGCERAYGVTIQSVIRDYYPPVVNDRKLVQLIKSVYKEDEFTEIAPLMISEDFSFYQQVVSGCFVLLGTKNEDKRFYFSIA